MKTIFIFAYYSYKDPVFQSAVLPYFVDFPNKEAFRFILITFEQKKYRTNKQERRDIDAFLKKQNIQWYNVNWHSGRFKLIKKAYDFTVGMLLSSWIIIRHQVDIIYSEAFPGAIITHILSRIFRKPHMIHSFEPHTEYMVEGGVWASSSWEARLLGRFEKVIARKASVIMTATRAMIERFKKEGVTSTIIRVPSCVDIQHFQYMPDARQQIRSQLGITDSECVIVCIGKMGGMYWQEEIFAFFRACLVQDSRFRFLFYTPDEQEKICNYAEQYQISKDRLSIGFLRREQVPAHLSAADFGLVHVHQYPSKRFCSPIKDGEYWACGLPIIIPKGVSDDFKFAEEEQIGFVLDGSTEKSFSTVAQQLLSVWQDKTAYASMRERCRKFVEADRNVARYQEIYRNTFLKN